MPMHDWTPLPDEIYLAFHQRRIAATSDRLHVGLLPSDPYASPEQAAGWVTPDVLTHQAERPDGGVDDNRKGVAV